jgi:hypothetical protein
MTGCPAESVISHGASNFANAQSPGKHGVRSRHALLQGALLRNHLLQLAVLSLEFLEPLCFRNFHPAELRSSAIERLLRDVVQPAGCSDVSSLLGFVQNPNDLLFRESLLLHLVSDQPKGELRDWIQYREAGQIEIAFMLRAQCRL